MKNRTKLRKQIAAATLITSIISCNTAGTVYAGPPTVTTDEALYVNLDYYGNELDSSVVKGVSLNGLRTFTDYGVYTDVTNMSNYAKPVIEDGKVTWQLPKDAKERFYYECQLQKGEIALPWNFDISYKLNGMPKEAKDLVHANGLVEIDVHCIPNESARDYYKNNMLLQVGTLVDMENTMSVSAPGSQTQAMGTYKVVIFAAVPGEEKTFHMEISTNDFESMGLIMMMIPGTLDQMNEISDIKEVKEAVADSTDELLDGMNEILDTLDRISSGMSAAQSGLEQLKKAQASFDASKDSIIANADVSLDSLEALSGKIDQLAPDINANKQSLDEINHRVNAIVKTLGSSGNDFFELAGRLGDLQDLLSDLQSDMNSGNQDAAREHMWTIRERLTALQDVLDQIVEQAGALPEEVSEDEISAQEEVLNSLMEEIYGILDDLESVVGSEAVEQLRSQLEQIAGVGIGGSSPKLLAEAARKLSNILGGLKNLIAELSNTMDAIDSDLDEGIQNGQDLAGQIGAIMGKIETLIGDINDLNRTVNQNKEAFDTMLDDAAASAEQIGNGTRQIVVLLRSVQDTVKANRSAVENGTKQTLDGLISILENASNTSNATGKLQDANEDLRSNVKGELDKLEDETNLLEMDPTQEMVSFTSDENPAPSSIQIILRTEEISEEDVTDNAVDIEPVPEPVGLWQRIVNVFQKIWNAVRGFFS